MEERNDDHNDEGREQDPVKDKDTVAITGSPNTVNEIAFDVMQGHLRTPLLGALVKLDVPMQSENGQDTLLTLAQVTNIETSNRWHEDHSLKNYLKLRGKLQHLTEVGDVTTGILQVLGAYRKTDQQGQTSYEKLCLPIPPGSGIPVQLVKPALVRQLMAPETGYGYIAYFSGSQNVPAPVYVKHFGDYNDKGSGESYMGGIFGPSGCGKSIIAATLIALWTHNPQLGVMIIDPVSEFSKNAFASGTQFDFDFFDILAKFSNGRFTKSRLVTLDRLQLEGTRLFVAVLEQKGFFDAIGVGPTKTSDAMQSAHQMLEDLRDRGIWNEQMTWQQISNMNIPGGTLTQTFADLFIGEMARIYAASSRRDKIAQFQHTWTTSLRHLERKWDDTLRFFLPTTTDGTPRANLNNIVREVMERGAIYIMDINPEMHQMGDSFKTTLMDFIFRRLRGRSHQLYSQRKPANCLIVIDEAGRFIPQDPENETLRSLAKTLTESVKELRKSRCGFLFITQTISEIQKDIYRNLHYRIYGVGLGVGVDADHIRNKEGNDAYELYSSLPDPRLSRKFSFMVAGVLLALGSSGKPMIVEGYPGGQALLLENSHLIDNPEDFSGLGRAPR